MNKTEQDNQWLEQAIELSRQGMKSGEGGPFGCIIVRQGQIVGRGSNKVTSSNDPTAHAEVVAIRDACKNLGSYQLADCDIFTSCEPCPMCLGAIYWARPSRIYFACTHIDAAEAGFDDSFIYKEINITPSERKIPSYEIMREEGKKVFSNWISKSDKITY